VLSYCVVENARQRNELNVKYSSACTALPWAWSGALRSREIHDTALAKKMENCLCNSAHILIHALTVVLVARARRRMQFQAFTFELP